MKDICVFGRKVESGVVTFLTTFFILSALFSPGVMAAPADVSQAKRTLSGVVTDFSTGEPVIGAYISIVGKNDGAISDLDGEEKKIIYLRFFKNKTQAVTAQILGKTQVQISRKERKIIAKMLRLYKTFPIIRQFFFPILSIKLVTGSCQNVFAKV